MAQPDQFHLLSDQSGAVGLAAVLVHRVDRQRDILLHRQPGKQRVGLEHQPPVAVRPVDGLAAQQHLAAVRLNQPRDGADQRGLARPRKAQDRDEFAFLDVQVDTAQHFGDAAGLAGVAFRHVLQRKDRLHVRSPLPGDQIWWFLETSA